MDSTGVQVTLWQLSREKSLIAKRSELKGNSGHTSKANFGNDICEFESSSPSQPVRSWRSSVNTGNGPLAEKRASTLFRVEPMRSFSNKHPIE
jgi:hypothetical protein